MVSYHVIKTLVVFRFAIDLTSLRDFIALKIKIMQTKFNAVFWLFFFLFFCIRSLCLGVGNM